MSKEYTATYKFVSMRKIVRERIKPLNKRIQELEAQVKANNKERNELHEHINNLLTENKELEARINALELELAVQKRAARDANQWR